MALNVHFISDTLGELWRSFVSGLSFIISTHSTSWIHLMLKPDQQINNFYFKVVFGFTYTDFISSYRF